MYYYISGDLVKTDLTSAVIDNNGIAYLFSVSASTLRAIAGKDKVRLYTYFSVREDAQELYGFVKEEELDTFKLLIAISGVGPKAALAILSTLTPDKLATAVRAADIKAISAAPGIGKKLAERIVLELKDKLASADSDSAPSGVVLTDEGAGNAAEAVNALVVLGYSRAEATHAVGAVDTAGMEIDDIIRAALKRLI